MENRNKYLVNIANLADIAKNNKWQIEYDSDVDSIEIIHTAKNRRGFAIGTILATEWLLGKKGIYEMKDLLSL